MDFFQLFRIVLKIRTILAMFLVYRLVFWNNELQTTLFWTSIGKQIKLFLNFYLFLHHHNDENHNSMRFSRKILETRADVLSGSKYSNTNMFLIILCGFSMSACSVKYLTERQCIFYIFICFLQHVDNGFERIHSIKISF